MSDERTLERLWKIVEANTSALERFARLTDSLVATLETLQQSLLAAKHTGPVLHPSISGKLFEQLQATREAGLSEIEKLKLRVQRMENLYRPERADKPTYKPGHNPPTVMPLGHHDETEHFPPGWQETFERMFHDVPGMRKFVSTPKSRVNLFEIWQRSAAQFGDDVRRPMNAILWRWMKSKWPAVVKLMREREINHILTRQSTASYIITVPGTIPSDLPEFVAAMGADNGVLIDDGNFVDEVAAFLEASVTEMEKREADAKNCEVAANVYLPAKRAVDLSPTIEAVIAHMWPEVHSILRQRNVRTIFVAQGPECATLIFPRTDPKDCKIFEHILDEERGVLIVPGQFEGWVRDVATAAKLTPETKATGTGPKEDK